MEFLGLGYWAIIAIIALLSYLFLIGIVSSVVFLDNVLPRIPPQIETPERVRAKHVDFSTEDSELRLKNEQISVDFDGLITGLAQGVAGGEISKVRELYNLGEFNDAISTAAAIAISDPSNIEVMRLLARTLDRIEQYDFAILVWDELAATTTIDEEIAMRRIRIRYSSKQFELCIEACKDLVQASIDDILAYKMMGKSLLNLDRKEDALEIFHIIENNWSDNESESNIDRILFSLERYTELHSRIIARDKQTEIDLDGLRFLARVEGRLKHENLVTTLEKISQKTDNVDDWYEVARVAFNRKQYQDSITATEKALYIDSEHEKSRTLRVRSLIIEERYADAIEEMNELENQGVLNEKLLIRRAEISFKLGQIELARTSYQDIWENIGLIAAAHGLARCLIREERYQEVLDLIDSIDEDENHILVPIKLQSLQKLSRLGELLRCFEQRRALAEKYPRMFHFAANAEKTSGNPTRAIELWRELLVVVPDDLEANYSIAATCYDNKENIDAKKYVDIVLKIEPANERAMWLSSQIHVRNEDWELAFAALEELCSMSPSTVKYWRSYIENLYRLNRKSEAESIFDFAIESIGESVQQYPEFIFLAEEFLWRDKARELCEEFLKSSGDLPAALVQLIDGYYSSGRAGSACRYAIRLKQRNHQLFENSNGVSKLMNLLEWADVTLLECGGDPFWGQWKDEVFNTELVAKAIVQKASIRPKNWQGIERMAMVSSTIGRGGAERQMMFCLNELQDDHSKGYQMDLFLHRDASRDPEKTYLGDLNTTRLDIKEYGFPRMADYLNHEMRYELEPWIELISHIPETSQNQRNLISLFYHFVEGRYDLVHAWQDLTNVIVAMAALMAGVPRILMSARSLSPDTKTMLHMRKAGFLKGAYLHLLSSENVVLCHNSEAGAQSYRNWLNSNEHWFPVLHNGTSFDELIDHLDEEEVLKLNEYLQWKNGRIAIGSVFRFVPEKRPLLWVDVANNLLKSRSDVCFVMVGNGALYEEVIEKVNQLGISEYFFFPGLSNSVGNWLENMDLFLLTSRIEGLPNVIIEAQGFGVPVVSTDAGGAEEVIIPDVSGLIAKQNHISEISGLLLKSIEDEEWRINAKQVSRIHAREKFSIDGMYTRLLELYGKMG